MKGAKAVFWNRRYEPAVLTRDAGVKDARRGDGLVAESFNAALLHEPWTIQNQSGKPFQVFTAFWKNCLAKPDPVAPQPAVEHLRAPPEWPKSLPLAALELEPKLNWAEGFRGQAAWRSGRNREPESLFGASVRRLLDATRPPRPHGHIAALAAPAFWRTQSATGLAWTKTDGHETWVACGKLAWLTIPRPTGLERVCPSFALPLSAHAHRAVADGI